MAHAPTAPAPPDPNPPDLDATVMDVLPLASSGGNSLALAIALANELKIIPLLTTPPKCL